MPELQSNILKSAVIKGNSLREFLLSGFIIN